GPIWFLGAACGRANWVVGLGSGTYPDHMVGGTAWGRGQIGGGGIGRGRIPDPIPNREVVRPGSWPIGRLEPGPGPNREVEAWSGRI
ncbi:hypothetical protein KI387_025900, partial [Taxus chinensis]